MSNKIGYQFICTTQIWGEFKNTTHLYINTTFECAKKDQFSQYTLVKDELSLYTYIDSNIIFWYKGVLSFVGAHVIIIYNLIRDTLVSAA